jgi:hypothetical protein
MNNTDPVIPDLMQTRIVNTQGKGDVGFWGKLYEEWLVFALRRKQGIRFLF